MEKIRKQLAPYVQFVNSYEFVERPKSELDPARRLEDIEAHGITSHQRMAERVFVCRGEKVSELTPSRKLVRVKSYQTSDNRDETGAPIGDVLDGKEQWVAIVSSAFVTQPKGPHGTEKRVEVFA